MPGIKAGGEAGEVAVLVGDWTLLGLGGRFDELAAEASALHAHATDWDLSGIQALDHAGALLLWRAWGRQLPPGLRCAPEHRALLSKLHAPPCPQPPRGRALLGMLHQGRLLLGFARHLLDALTLLGQLGLDLLTVLRRPRLMPWREISAHVYRGGAQAMGITALVGFLVGITLSYLSARQLQNYGADIYVVNILGISVWRELGPLLAAILVAGRSGSAMTAQLGVMRVTQELDALSVMGISHTIRLVWPKVLALGVAMPLVVVWTSSLILLGGMVAARATLGLDYVQFIRGLPAAVPVANLWLGLGKSVVFGLLIAFVACYFGLRIKPNSESLAAGTTESVVSAITVVIIVDAIFAVIFSGVGL